MGLSPEDSLQAADDLSSCGEAAGLCCWWRTGLTGLSRQAKAEGQTRQQHLDSSCSFAAKQEIHPSPPRSPPIKRAVERRGRAHQSARVRTPDGGWWGWLPERRRRERSEVWGGFTGAPAFVCSAAAGRRRANMNPHKHSGPFLSLFHNSQFFLYV